MNDEPKTLEWAAKQEYETLLAVWRYAKVGDPLFQDESGKAYADIMEAKRKKLIARKGDRAPSFASKRVDLRHERNTGRIDSERFRDEMMAISEAEDGQGEDMKPDCYKCKHQGDNPGSAHIHCNHPKCGSKGSNPLAEVFAILGSVGRGPGAIDFDAAKELGIVGNAHGIRGGWFQWPYNFDPIWLEACNGFEKKEKP